MHFKGNIRKRHLLWFGAVIFSLFIVYNSSAETKNSGAKNPFIEKNIDLEKATFFKMTARVGKTNIDESYIVIAEDRFLVVVFMQDGENRGTIMKDSNDNEISLENFSRGNLVTVEAAKLTDGSFVAMTIQKVRR